MPNTHHSTTYNECNRPASIGQGLDTILIGYGDGLDRDQEIWKQGSTVQILHITDIAS